MLSTRLLKLFILFFAFVCVRYWAIRQIWIPAEEHIRQIERRDCTPDEAILNAMGKDYFRPLTRSVSMLVAGATKCDWARIHFIDALDNKECHLPMLVHAEHTVLKYKKRGEEFIVGTKDCPMILVKWDQLGNRKRFCAVRNENDDGKIQWETEPCPEEE